MDCTFTGAPVVMPHIHGAPGPVLPAAPQGGMGKVAEPHSPMTGRLRALAVSSAQRLPALPDVPTVAESGYAGFEADQWYGIVAPAGMPAAMVTRLNAEINKALALPDVAQQLAIDGAVPMPGSPQEFGDLIKREIPRWAEVVKAGNLRPD